MDEKQLLRVSLFVAVIGVIGLVLLTYVIVPSLVEIGSITESMAEEKVTIAGSVSQVKVSPKVSSLVISDTTGSMRVISFDGFPEISKGDMIEVQGSVSVYKGDMELIAEKIKVVH